MTVKICNLLKKNGVNPEVLIEPTCGKGNFIIAALKTFHSIQTIYCMDIQKHYEHQFKDNLENSGLNFQDINFQWINGDVFHHAFPKTQFKEKRILILGNPPWVTNTYLSKIDSANMPAKRNIKQLKGLDAITGKSNFDIAESIIVRLVNEFQDFEVDIAMLCKNTVVRNLIRDAEKLDVKFKKIKAYSIDSKEEFGISAAASLIHGKVGEIGTNTCEIASLDKPSEINVEFGWVNGKFVSDISAYKEVRQIDGKCIKEWRQGVKHDAAKIMILEKNSNGTYSNGWGEAVDIEEDLLYPFIKGSGLRVPVVNDTNLYIITTQQELNQETSYIKDNHPKTWKYLLENAEKLDGRGSSIYKNRPRFSIFGIGDYSFKPYKIGISSFYSSPIFCLINHIGNKPVLVDDTSYIISFNNPYEAITIWGLLNSEPCKKFLKSISFSENKRVFTKGRLMRVDLWKLSNNIDKDKVLKDIVNDLKSYNYTTRDEISIENVDLVLQELKQEKLV